MSGRDAEGRVILVGAGPGDPDLITVRGAAALRSADVVLFDELASSDLLALARDDAELINVGKRGHDAPTRTQDETNALLIERARAGATVVRLKGGDPFVFGRGGEEASACLAAGVRYEVVPGVSSAIAALAYAGIPVTDRRHSASFAVVTGHKDPSKAAQDTRWRALGSAVDTVIILMGMRNLRELLGELVAGGMAEEMPAAAVMHGTRPDQKVVISTVAQLPDAVEEAGLAAPSVVAVGHVVELRAQRPWWETQPLFGMRALVTRAAGQAREMAAALRAAGAVPVRIPMIELVRPDDRATRGEIEAAVAAVGEYDAVLFASTNAVRFFAAALRAAGRRPADVAGRVLCIGARTARTALDAGLPVHMVAGGGGDADAMLAEILAGGSVAGQRILIPRSDLGRNVLPEGLREAGAEVDAVQFYRNVRAEVDAHALRRALCEGDLPILTFTSPSIVNHFAELLDERARAAARRCIIAAIGRTTGRALDAVGLPATVIPEKPDVRALVDAVSESVRAAGAEEERT